MTIVLITEIIVKIRERWTAKSASCTYILQHILLAKV